ncbi:signal peptidase II [Streptomyces griseoflavus]|uniref:signal peptidase II n=1 Tax=Streptomyces griseoflavus TaxID=35619 RepID=UPI00339FC348
MAEAERIIGTPDIPDADRDEQDRDGQRRAGTEGTAADTGRPGTDGAAADTGRPRGKRRIAVLFAVAAFAYALDLISKMIVVAKLEHHEPIEIVGDWLRFEAIRNAGAAFGFGEAFTVIFTVIAAAVIVVIIRLARKLYSLPWAIALGLLLGGALGNLTDRIFRSPGVFEGAVVDFIAPKHFAVFNLADSAIVCGGILIVLLSFRGLDPDGTVHKD